MSASSNERLLRRTLRATGEALADICGRNEALTESIRGLQARNVQLHTAVRQRTDRIAELEQRDDDLTAQNAALRRDNESLREKVIFLKGKEERKSDRIDGSKDDLSDRAVTRALAESRAECKEMQLAMNAGKIARQRLLAKLDALGRERDQFRSKVQELRSALTDLTGHRDKALEFAAALSDTMKDHGVSLQ